ncbi:MAG: hypothetical protein HY301_15635 [Verrucomicrobia bacterium]|nr:hypothetical protein [Verrucomicrobiota bacterium]
MKTRKANGPLSRRFAAASAFVERYFITAAFALIVLVLAYHQPWIGALAAGLGALYACAYLDPLTRLHGGHTLRAHYGPLRAVDFSGDGRIVRAVSAERVLIEWDAGTRAMQRVRIGELHVASPPIPSPNGRLYAQLAGGSAKVCDAVSGEPLPAFCGGLRGIECVAFSCDSARVAMSAGRTVSVWELATGRRVRVLRGHRRRVTGLAFAPDGGLASTSADGTVKLWRI